MIISDLDDIKSNWPNASERLDETLQMWLKKGGEKCTWETLVAAVRKDNNAAADAIEAESKSYNVYIIHLLFSFPEIKIK